MAVESLFWTLAAVLAVASGQDEHSVCDVAEIRLGQVTTALLYSPSSRDNVSSTNKCTVRVTTNKYSYRTIQLDVTSFSLGGHEPCSINQEYLQISFPYSGRGDVDTIRWCGQSYTPRLETRQVMDITYFPGPQTQRGPGFNITITTDVRFHCGGRELMVGDQPMFLYSPGYPAPYDKNMIDCKWEVRSKDGSSLLVDTPRFSLEDISSCGYDYVQIDNSKYCGDQRVQFTSKRSWLELKFVTDHLTEEDGFIFKFIESPSGSVACGTEVVAVNAPRLLQLPIIDHSTRISADCWWRVDSRSNDSVVLLEMNNYDTTAPCSDFSIRIYDGRTGSGENRILQKCSRQKMFHTIRSSFGYLYIDAILSSIGHSRVNVSFTYTLNRRDTPPRVLYADFAPSYVWLDLEVGLDLGLLIQGVEGSVDDYSTCVELYVTTFNTSSSVFNNINASKVIYAFSGWNESFAELTTACGRPDSEQILSRGSKLFIKLRENRPPSLRYVWLVYRLLRNCKPDTVRLQSEYMTPQTLQSDFSLQNISGTFRPTNHYPNNVYCRWLIAPQNSEYFVRVHVQKSSMYNSQDSVNTYDYQSDSGGTSLLLTWTGVQTPTILSTKGNSLLLEFFTNEKFTDAGFTLDYLSVKHLSDCPSMATLIAGDENHLLSSPNYPYNYPNNVDCRWRITSTTGVVELTVLSLSIDQGYGSCFHRDYLAIYDGPDTSGRVLANLCGNNQTLLRTYSSSSGSVLVRFHTDQSATSTGFSLQYKTSMNSDHWRCNREILVTENSDREITSPFYPNPYPGNVDCYWQVRALLTQIVMLEVVDLDVPCSHPVLLYDGSSDKYRLLARPCSDNYQNQYLSSQQSMYVTFRPNSNSGRRGFRFRLRSWEGSSACQGQVDHLIAYTNKRYITSPGYPGQYPPNSDCQWRIESAYRNMSVYVEIEDAKVEPSSSNCDFDSITFYDGYGKGSPQLGKFCGEKQVSYSSHGIYMFVSFITDNRIQFRGFRMAYWVGPALPHSTSAPGASYDGSSTAKIVGGVMGGVVLIVIGIVAYLCLTGRCQRCRASSQRRPSRQRSRSERGSTVFVMSPVIVNNMPPPPYPAVTNGSYVVDDLPPTYSVANASLQQPPPPSYRELDVPPPYTDAMMESYPPSSPSPSPGGSEGGGADFTNHNYQSLSPEVSGPAHHRRQSSDHDYDRLSDTTVTNNVRDERQSSARSTDSTSPLLSLQPPPRGPRLSRAVQGHPSDDRRDRETATHDRARQQGESRDTHREPTNHDRERNDSRDVRPELVTHDRSRERNDSRDVHPESATRDRSRAQDRSPRNARREPANHDRQPRESPNRDRYREHPNPARGHRDHANRDRSRGHEDSPHRDRANRDRNRGHDDSQYYRRQEPPNHDRRRGHEDSPHYGRREATDRDRSTERNGSPRVSRIPAHHGMNRGQNASPRMSRESPDHDRSRERNSPLRVSREPVDHDRNLDGNNARDAPGESPNRHIIVQHQDSSGSMNATFV